MDKKGELISIHIGQTGVQIGNACWELYCMEHGLQSNGQFSHERPPLHPNEIKSLNPLFSETSTSKYVPRALFVDLEPTVVDEIRNGQYGDLHHPDNIINGKESAANNYARGYYTTGSEIINSVTDRIRMLTEDCSGLDGFMLFHSFGGGTGSGFTSLLMQSLAEEYAKKTKFEFAVCPSLKTESLNVAPYNTVLNTYNTMERSDCTFMVDNKAIYDICANQLNMPSANFNNVNRLIAQIVSSITAPMRFDGSLNVNISELQTNLVPFPRLHFPVVSYAPFIPKGNIDHEVVSVENITNACFDLSNQMMNCESSNGTSSHGTYMACCVFYRGDVKPQDVSIAIENLKQKKTVHFAKWMQTGFKVGINEQPPVVPCDDFAGVSRSVCTLSNTSRISEAWKIWNAKFELMFTKKAFVHWYIDEGMDIDEFRKAQEDLTILQHDYEETKIDECDEDGVAEK